MNNGPTTTVADSKESVLQQCMATLRHVAEYRLPAATDRRLLWLSENKECLTEVEREELLSLVAWTEERTQEKLQAQLVMQRMAEKWPELTGTVS